MIRETKELIWLTADEVEKAVREYARAAGAKVTSYAAVTGLSGLSEAKCAVAVSVESSSEVVK